MILNSQVSSNTFKDNAVAVAMLEQAPLMACGAVGVQHYKWVLLVYMEVEQLHKL